MIAPARASRDAHLSTRLTKAKEAATGAGERASHTEEAETEAAAEDVGKVLWPTLSFLGHRTWPTFSSFAHTLRFSYFLLATATTTTRTTAIATQQTIHSWTFGEQDKERERERNGAILQGIGH